MRRTILGSAVISLFLSSILVIACTDDATPIPPPTNPDAGLNTPDGSSSSSSGDPDSSTASDTSTTLDSGPGTPVPDADCVAFADGYCDLISRCFPIALGGYKDDLPACKTRTAITCAISIQAPGAAKPSNTCSAKLKAALCTDNLSDIDPSCHIKGQIGNDAACEYDGQCLSGNCFKVKNAPGPCGVCKPRSPENGSCLDTVCDYGLQCAEGTCVKPVALNGGCTKGKCHAPNRCTGGAVSPATCKAPVATSGACPTNPPANNDEYCDGTKGDYCKAGAIGAPAGTCTAIAFVDAAASCGIVNGGLSLCKAGSQCKGAAGLTPGKCIANAADGASCNTTSGPDCTFPAECINGACSFPSPSRCK